MPEIDDLEQDLLVAYLKLCRGLTDMIEAKRLTRADIPDDYDWLTFNLTHLKNERTTLQRAIDTELTP